MVQQIHCNMNATVDQVIRLTGYSETQLLNGKISGTSLLRHTLGQEQETSKEE